MYIDLINKNIYLIETASTNRNGRSDYVTYSMLQTTFPTVNSHHEVVEPTQDTNNRDMLVTPTSPYGFWLGAGHKHSHGSEEDSVNDEISHMSDVGKQANPELITATQSQENQRKDIGGNIVPLNCSLFKSQDLQLWGHFACDRSAVQICVRNL